GLGKGWIGSALVEEAPLGDARLVLCAHLDVGRGEEEDPVRDPVHAATQAEGEPCGEVHQALRVRLVELGQVDDDGAAVTKVLADGPGVAVRRRVQRRDLQPLAGLLFADHRALVELDLRRQGEILLRGEVNRLAARAGEVPHGAAVDARTVGPDPLRPWTASLCPDPARAVAADPIAANTVATGAVAAHAAVAEPARGVVIAGVAVDPGI